MSVVMVAVFLIWPMTTLAQSKSETAQTVYFVSSGNLTLDKYFTDLVSENLGPEFKLKPLPKRLPPAKRNHPIITMGPKAFERTYRNTPDAVVVGTFVDREFMDKYATEQNPHISAIYYDVPLLRQALTGKVILPQADKVAILASYVNRDSYDELIEQLPAYGLEGKVFVVTDKDQLIPTVIRALSYGDFILGTSDHDIYHPRNIKHILLTAYRRNKILIGPSQAFVKAGAIASSYAPFSSIAEKTAQYILYYRENANFPAAAYPDSYKVDLNEQVARSLNIPLPERPHVSEAVNELLKNNSRGSIQ
ncbi:ABC transporter substrate-binding protein [Marinobacter litoralis]|nr:ABC transporter substrate-binding protein [Marinobacter litoralis]MBJ6138947.1 ABC transporter substrate-binding protein [Marinobacter litoralis]